MRNVGIVLAAGLVGLAAVCATPRPSQPASAPPPPAVIQPAAVANPSLGANGRVGGVVQRVAGSEVTLLGGEQFTVGADVRVIRSVPVDARALEPGEFVAVTAKRDSDDTLVAFVVNIFPESMRGLGVGQRPMDSGNLMTNATIDGVAPNLMTNATIDGMAAQSFTVSFPGGADTVRLADDGQVNEFHLADATDLMPGTSITASVNNGSAQFITIL